MKGSVALDHLGFEVIPIALVEPYEGNTRTHSPEQIDKIVESIRAFGWSNPLIVDEHNKLIAGHGRLMAAQQLAMEMVPVVRMSGLSETQRRALIIADNQLAITGAGWDEERLREEIEALTVLGFDIPLIGFDAAELDRLFNPPQPGNTDPDALPEEPAVAASAPGDVWIMPRSLPKCPKCGEQARLKPRPRIP